MNRRNNPLRFLLPDYWLSAESDYRICHNDYVLNIWIQSAILVEFPRSISLSTERSNAS